MNESETGATTSVAGEGWRRFYESGSLSWVSPSEVDCASISRLAEGATVRKLLDLAALTVDQNARVLEAGCGVGLYARALGRMGYRVDAFNFNEAAVEVAGQLAASSAPDARVRFDTGNLLAIASERDTYDLLFNQAAGAGVHILLVTHGYLPSVDGLAAAADGPARGKRAQ